MQNNGGLALRWIPSSGQESGIQPGHSGTYGDPGRSGEGFIVEILDDEQAVVIWFTYPPDGSATGKQAWLGGVGRIEGSRIIVENAVITRGTSFGSGFDPDTVERLPWGTLEMTFADCDNASVSYQGPEAFGSGTLEARRISGVERLRCGAAGADANTPVPAAPGISGQWFDPATSGQGWFLQEVTPGQVLLAWFTFDSEQHQAWVLGVGEWSNDGGELVFADLRIPRGTYFGEAFNSDNVERIPWGSLRMVFEDCAQARLEFESSMPEFGSGALQPRRLTRLSGLGCDFQVESGLQ